MGATRPATGCCAAGAGVWPFACPAGLFGSSGEAPGVNPTVVSVRDIRSVLLGCGFRISNRRLKPRRALKTAITNHRRSLLFNPKSAVRNPRWDRLLLRHRLHASPVSGRLGRSLGIAFAARSRWLLRRSSTLIFAALGREIVLVLQEDT